jgi:hypothetical protein
MGRFRSSFTAIAIFVWVSVAAAQGDLQHQLIAKYPLTKVTADKSGIVTAGTILVLQKDGLMCYPSHFSAAPVNSYKKGKLSVGFGDSFKTDMVDRLGLSNGETIPRKTLVSGEKFWLADAQVKDDKIDLAVVTEPYDDGRYFAIIRIPLGKGQQPSADEMFKMIGEVVTVQPADTSAQPAPAPAPAPLPAMAPIAPPPPPADTPPPAPKTISLGQTKDVVTANFGPPQKIVKLGAKEIDTYPDMKVTFVNGKVTDVQ